MTLCESESSENKMEEEAEVSSGKRCVLVLIALLMVYVSLGNSLYHSSLSFPICYMRG